MSKSNEHATLRSLSNTEINAVAGGLMYGPDVSGMPDRSIMCGTMWLWDRLINFRRGGR